MGEYYIPLMLLWLMKRFLLIKVDIGLHLYANDIKARMPFTVPHKSFRILSLWNNLSNCMLEIKVHLSSFKSSENIQKKVGGPDRNVSKNCVRQ